MAISVVETGIKNIAPSGTTQTIPIATTPLTGDVVVVIATAVTTNTAFTVTGVSGLGATWTVVDEVTGLNDLAMTVAVGRTPSAAGNISVTLSASRYGAMRAYLIRGGLNPTVTTDLTAYRSTGTTLLNGPSTSVAAGDVVINAVIDATTLANTTFTSTGWTFDSVGGLEERTTNPAQTMGSVYQVPTTSGTVSTSVNTSVSIRARIGAVRVRTGSATTPATGSATSGAFTWAGAATGVRTPKATAAGTFTWAGAASGVRAPKATAAGAFQWTGSAVGAAPVLPALGSATGAFQWSGAATGSAPAVGVNSGNAIGSFNWDGNAVGKFPAKGDATGSFDWAGVAVGSAGSSASGVAGGTFGWSSLAFGDNGQARATVSVTHTPVGILSVIPLLPVTPLEGAVPITRVSVLAPNLSAAYPQHPAPGEPGAPAVIEEVVGYPQLFIGGRNVTNFRDAPTIIRRWESEAPFGDTVAAFEFPQLNPWDKPGVGDLDFLGRDARVAIGLREEVAPGAFRVRRLWSGFLDARGNGLGEGEDYAWEAKGTFWQAASYIREPHPITEPVDIGVWIARVMNAIEGRRWAAMPLTPIGITTMTRGSRDQTGWDYVQELLSEAITDDFRQWTLLEVAPGVPRLVLKPAPTEVHATVAYGTPGVDIDLRVDESTRVDRIFMRGVGPKMGGWANVYYPWIGLLNQAPAYPMASLTDYIVLGTTDADTVTGAGVTDFQRRVDELEGFSNPAVSGTMTAAWMAVVDDLQRRLHITVGPLGPQTWERVFDDRPNPEALKPRRLPMASKDEAEKYLYDVMGKRLPGVNPAWDGRVPRDIAIDIGVGKTKAEGFKLARKLLGLYGSAAANGQIVWQTDPREIDRTRLSHLSNVKVTGFEGEDRVLQVASKSVEYDTGGDGPLYVLTTRVDERARDAMVVEDLLNQRREAKADPSRRPGVTNRSSRQVSDQRTPWDSESVCGRLPRTAVNGAAGVWTIKWIPFAEVGKLARIELHSDHPFAFAIFASLRITEGKLDARGNPFDSADFWRDNKDYFDEYGIIEAWGEKDDACGYSPKSEADGGAFTGDFILDTPVDYWTESPPAVAVAIFMRGGSGHISGRFVPAFEP